MKKLFALSLLCLMALTVLSATIDGEQARSKAEALLGKRTKQLEWASPARGHDATPMPDAYYMFNAEDGRGYAIIAAEDALGDVLGYSHDGHLTLRRMPDALVDLLVAYEQYVAAYRSGLAEAPSGARISRANGVAPMVKTQWGQDAPYYNLCPQGTKGNCPTGCVATAVAQIMKFWNWPAQGKGYGVANYNGALLQGSLEHNYQWDAMQNTTSENLASEQASAAVAELVYDCGLAVGMSYGDESSGAGTPIKAFYNSFGYIPTMLRNYRRDCFADDDEWLTLIFSEIDNGRPVYYTASSLTDGGKDSAGHAFVVDGYDTTGKMHINWGWDGSSDGYFAVTEMNPSGYTFTIDQAVITGIEPARNGETGVPVEYPYMTEQPTCDQSGTVNKAITLGITVAGIWNHTGSTHNWSVSVGLFDTHNKMIGDVKVRGGGIASLNLKPNYGYNGTVGTVNCSLSSKTLDNGHYALRIIFKESGSWILPDMKGGQQRNAVYIELNGNKISFTDGKAYNAEVISNGIETVTVAQQHSGITYDLTGRKVSTPGKGVYIRNGKKVLK